MSNRSISTLVAFLISAAMLACMDASSALRPPADAAPALARSPADQSVSCMERGTSWNYGAHAGIHNGVETSLIVRKPTSCNGLRSSAQLDIDLTYNLIHVEGSRFWPRYEYLSLVHRDGSVTNKLIGGYGQLSDDGIDYDLVTSVTPAEDVDRIIISIGNNDLPSVTLPGPNGADDYRDRELVLNIWKPIPVPQLSIIRPPVVDPALGPASLDGGEGAPAVIDFGPILPRTRAVIEESCGGGAWHEVAKEFPEGYWNPSGRLTYTPPVPNCTYVGKVFFDIGDANKAIGANILPKEQLIRQTPSVTNVVVPEMGIWTCVNSLDANGNVVGEPTCWWARG